MEKNLKEKQFYSIGEVSEIVGIKDYIIRFWEKEFDQLNPIISKKGNRRKYGIKDIHIIKRIKYLVHQEGYTLSGANKQLSHEIKNDSHFFQESKIIGDKTEPKESREKIRKGNNLKMNFILQNLYEVLNLIKKG